MVTHRILSIWYQTSYTETKEKQISLQSLVYDVHKIFNHTKDMLDAGERTS
jgi:hypothetical protein